MFIYASMPQAMFFRRVNLKIMRLVVFDQFRYQHLSIHEMDIFINQPMGNE